MKSFKEFNFLKEGRYSGTLYHITSFSSLLEILKSDSLKVGSTGAISFTRNKNFLSKPSGSIILSGVGVMISLDAKKLTDNYKIEPYNYHGSDVEVGDEMEERVLDRTIKNIKKMITKIDLYGIYFPDDHRGLTLLKRKMGLGLDDEVTLSSFADYIKKEFRIKVEVKE